MTGVREPTIYPRGAISSATVSRQPRLTLREVRDAGLPAVFTDYGEVLLYLDGNLYSLLDAQVATQHTQLPLPLPSQVLETGVGLEYGWRHLSGCRCRCCGNPGQEAA